MFTNKHLQECTNQTRKTHHQTPSPNDQVLARRITRLRGRSTCSASAGRALNSHIAIIRSSLSRGGACSGGNGSCSGGRHVARDGR